MLLHESTSEPLYILELCSCVTASKGNQTALEYCTIHVRESMHRSHCATALADDMHMAWQPSQCKMRRNEPCSDVLARDVQCDPVRIQWRLSQNSAQGTPTLEQCCKHQVVRQWTDENICMCKMNIYQDKPSKSQTKVGLLAAVVISVHA